MRTHSNTPKNNPLSGAHTAPEYRAAATAKARALLQSLPLPAGTTLAATGSLARGEMTPHSDVDLILLYRGAAPTEAELQQLWYPVWDAKMRLDYAVRTPAECAHIISQDMTAALALLDISFVAGDQTLVEETRAKVLAAWRRGLSKNFDTIVQQAASRWKRSGSVVTMTHPDLKHGRGGLRDYELIRALALGQVCDKPRLSQAHNLLLDTRTFLHVESRRPRDVLDPEFAADVSLDLHFDDRYELSRALAEAARSIDAALNDALAAARRVLPRPRGILRSPVRRPLDIDVVDAGGIITLSRNPDLGDPALPLRVAAAAARTGLEISPATWRALATVPPLAPPWPKAATADFFAVLASPEHGGAVIRAMDKHGLWEPLVPEWKNVRGMMPRERTHIHTVDEHTLETVARCAARTVTVARPDLLLLAALYHDIGKGRSRPHEQVGAHAVAAMSQRMGLDLKDRSCVQTLVAEHTLLARLASRHDPQADETRDRLLDALRYDTLTLDLLRVLAQADAEATGPGVWTPRLQRSMDIVVSRARENLRSYVPVKPFVHAPTKIGLEGNTVHWRGSYVRESVRVLALIAAKGWTIYDGRIVCDRPQKTGSTYGYERQVWKAQFKVRSSISAAFDSVEFVHAYRSGVFSTLPQVRPAATALCWHGPIVEVRTVDRPGCLGVLLAVLPDFDWATISSPGATMVARFRLCAGFDRSRVEKDVTKALGQA